MRNFIILVIIFLVSTVAHWALVTAGAGFNISFNFMLVAGIAACSFYERWAGYTFMFFGGLFLDFFGVNMFGAYAFTFTLCCAAVYTAKKSLDFESPLPQAVLVFCVTLGSILVYNLTGIIFLKGTSWHGFDSLILSAVFNALTAPFVFYILKILRLPLENKF
ncbi:MAG: rod shape-determining protein MreD [Elusimicrobium sp.]|jgi:rod shape-determining protein MreD|nr:rod shape-determining protein MreD [Elusimicrobium sp.]